MKKQETSTNATHTSTRIKSSAFPEDSLVNHTVLLEAGKELTTSVISGQQCLKALKSSGPAAYFLRMCLGSSLWSSPVRTLKWSIRTAYSERISRWTVDLSSDTSWQEYGETLKRWDTHPLFSILELKPSKPATQDNAVGLWHTPTTLDPRRTPEQYQSKREKDKQRLGRKSGGLGPGLQSAVLLWPTPTKSGSHHEDLDKFRERQARLKKRHGQRTGNGCGPSLGVAVQLWPTPIKSDGKVESRSFFEDRKIRTGRDNGTPLRVAVQEDEHGYLNPDWVEQLMGYPVGWTDPDVESVAVLNERQAVALPGQEQFVGEEPRTVSSRYDGYQTRIEQLGNSIDVQVAVALFQMIIQGYDEDQG